ncbi:cell division protein FtsK [Amycolatopsis sp. WQ 127309]|uniref:cell division protein FtsK n=1 Tax=Amycolatopsis sp. WQ 127309 TaxID=2932773 RepID=UPI001FF1F33C|nr:cell division protein FtsK [Amycolatopsis sp. WQ 127309]UOZ09369.1 cell division protein FtsK [Amycolatopsis sp. WQ 127309]
MDTTEKPDAGELATVHHLPIQPEQGEVIEGEIVTDEEYARLTSQRTRALARYEGYRRDVTVVVGAARKAATHEKTKVALHHSLTVVQGLDSWRGRLWDASTMGVYRRQIKAAEAMGDQALVAEWLERKARVQDARHRRVMDLPKLLVGLVKAGVIGLAALVVIVLLIGLLVQLSGAGEFTRVVGGVMDSLRFIFTAIAWAWTPLALVAPYVISMGVMLGAWREGRQRGKVPGWLATSTQDSDVTIDETTIAQALGALRIPQITNYLKEGLPMQYLTPARRDGRGTHAVVRLPAGVTAEKVARRRADLATGLHRLSKEVWPTTGSEAGILDLWVADKGALSEGAGAYPLLEDGAVDVFKGVPFGRTLRGEPMLAPLLERNTICGGMPGQGKSSAARVIMAGAALDPTAELRIWVPDANYDFEVFVPRCSRYVMGAEDEKIAQIAADLRELHAEVQRRGDLLVRYEIPAVTREYASKNVGLHPIFALLEEAHVAIQHKKYGEEIGQLLVDIVRLGRKRAIHLIVSTQAPTKDSMPRDVTRNCSNGVAFAVGDHVANDALLGQGAYSAGHRATELIPGTDKGTAVVKGFSGERSEIVQVYFLDVAKEHDQVTPILERSLAAIAKRGRVPWSTRDNTENEAPPAPRNLLEDLDEVLGDDPAPAAKVAPLLISLATEYSGLTGKQLCADLAAVGVKVPSSKNVYPVDPVTIRKALADQATADLDDEN